MSHEVTPPPPPPPPRAPPPPPPHPPSPPCARRPCGTALSILTREPDCASGSRCSPRPRPSSPLRHRRRLRVDVRDRRQRHHHQPARGDREQVLLAGPRVQRHPQRPDDRVADGDARLL